MQKSKRDVEIMESSQSYRPLAILLITIGFVWLAIQSGLLSFDTIGNFFGSFGESMGEFFGGFGESIGTFFGNMGEGFGNFFGSFGESIGAFFSNIDLWLPVGFIIVGIILIFRGWNNQEEDEFLYYNEDEA